MDALLTLPLVLAVVLVELAVGGAFLVWFLDRRGEAPAGFLKLTAAVDAVAAAAAVGLVPALPRGERAAFLNLDVIGSFGQAIAVVAALMVMQLILVFTPSRALRNVAGIVTVLTGIAALVVAAVARPASGESPYDVFALAALPLGALALGGVDGAMLLGHWYLVTPKLSTAPLRNAALVVVGAVALQLLVVIATVARGELAGTTQTGLVVAIGIRVGVGLLMTLGVALAAWWTARMNTQSSTGLLYVGLGTAFAGEISARVLFFLTGAAV